jgi:hypothetical protein
MPTNKDEQDRVVTQSLNQHNPYLARPEDFEVVTPDNFASRTQPFHGQRGDSDREEARLLAKRKAQGKGVTLGTTVDEAGPPNMGNQK